MSVMLYICMFCVALSMDLFALGVACLTVFVNFLVKQFAICFGVFVILLLNVMELLRAPNNTAYTRWSCHSDLVNPVQIVSTSPTPNNGAPNIYKYLTHIPPSGTPIIGKNTFSSCP